VAGGDHHPAGRTEVVGLEIDLFGAALADVDDLAAGTAQTGRQRLLQRRAAQAHVTPQHHRTRPQLCRQRHPDAAGDVFVQFTGDTATDVVGLEGGQGHEGSPS